jgi:hypothetical protein
MLTLNPRIRHFLSYVIILHGDSYRLIFNNNLGQWKKLCNGRKRVKLEGITCTKDRIENVVFGFQPWRSKQHVSRRYLSPPTGLIVITQKIIIWKNTAMQKAYLIRFSKFQTLSIPTGTKLTHILRVVAMLNTEVRIQKPPANADDWHALK